jgi:hypothetical protein
VSSLRQLQRHDAADAAGSLLDVGAPNATAASGIALQREVLRNRHIATYYGLVTVGAQEFRVMFDTGSCEFWVPSTECQTPRCLRHHRYALEQLPRFKADVDGAAATGARLAGPQLNITYISGHVTGPMVYDRVSVGGVTIPQQMVGTARRVDVALLDDVVWDGIMGLAYPNRGVLARGVEPVFETLMKTSLLTKRGLLNQFAYHVGDAGGSFTLGGADCSVVVPAGVPPAECVAKFGFVPVTQKEYWTLALEDVYATMPDGTVKRGLCGNGGGAGHQRGSGAGCRAIVDTGTYLVYGPSNHVRQVLPAVFARCQEIGALPALTFKMKVAPGAPAVELTLKPADYVLKFNVDQPRAAAAAAAGPTPTAEECVMGVAPDKDASWTLGQVFLRSYYALFDRENHRVGFARLPANEFKPIAFAETAAEVVAESATEAETEVETEVEAEAEAEAEADAEADAEAYAGVDTEEEVDEETDEMDE